MRKVPEDGQGGIEINGSLYPNSTMLRTHQSVIIWVQPFRKWDKLLEKTGIGIAGKRQTGKLSLTRQSNRLLGIPRLPG